MSKPNQEMRPSQFVLSYGPGSIVETQTGPVVVGSMSRLFGQLGRDPNEFEIIDGRLSNSQGMDGARIVRVPTNAELGWAQNEPVFPSTPFPYWSLCFRHAPDQVLYSTEQGGCPKCDGKPSAESGQNAVRFVLACPSGHLDEVNWDFIVHAKYGGQSCNPAYFLWRGGGRSLRQITIDCPQCGAHCNFGDAYGKPWPCRGRRVEVATIGKPNQCADNAQIMQRGASNIRVATTVSALTVMDFSKALHSALRDRQVITAAQVLKNQGILGRDALLEQLGSLDIGEMSMRVLQDTPWQQVERALEELFEESHSDGTQSIKDAEFLKLIAAAQDGAPPVLPDTPTAAPLFHVRKDDVCQFEGPTKSYSMRVTPIARLRMVIVQTGYRRVDPENGQIVGVEYKWGDRNWYPGVELFGEGLFIDLGESDLLTLHGSRVEFWNRKVSESTSGGEVHGPEHIWWHTLSHRLLNTLAVDSGYSAASIRERIYVCKFKDVIRGGVLLYTVQPGGDGTLGGLCSLAKQFDRIVDSALANLDVCSNDPLCRSAVHGGSNGAACYSCLFASETSCEYRNAGLDRTLLLENMP